MMDLYGDRHEPSAILFRASSENDAGNAVLTAACRVRYGREANPGNGRVIDDVVTAGNGSAKGSGGSCSFHFSAGVRLEFGKVVRHFKKSESEGIVFPEDRCADIDPVGYPDPFFANAQAKRFRFVGCNERRVNGGIGEGVSLCLTTMLPQTRNVDLRRDTPEGIRQPDIEEVMFAAFPGIEIDKSADRCLRD